MSILSVANIPAAKNYLHLLQNLYKSRHSPSDAKVYFSEAMLTLAEESRLNTGFGYCWFPKAGHVVVLSKPDLVNAFYKQPGTPFSQIPFFERLAVVLGPDNLMSHSSMHAELRKAILNRNEQFLKEVPDIVQHYFKKYTRPKPLTEAMDALSRAVLISAYFEKNMVNHFEEQYARSPNLTKDLLSLIELELLSKRQHHDLVLIRERLFAFGYDFLRAAEHGNDAFSWLNRLLKVRVQKHPTVCKTLYFISGISFVKDKWPDLSCQNWMHLLDYAREQADQTILSILLRDAVNESIFIPLLGFDATSTMLCTTLRIIMENPRIKTCIKEEINLLKTTTSTTVTSHISYIDALMQEALRLFPPTPIIPEIVTERFSLHHQGKTFIFPKNAMVIIPLKLLHRCPAIELTLEEQIQFGKKQITSETVFPERYNPRKPTGEPYLTRLYPPLANFLFFSFKGETAKNCPGSRLARSEGKHLIYQLLDGRDFKLFHHQPLRFLHDHSQSLQRNEGGSEGGGILLLEKLEKNLEPI